MILNLLLAGALYGPPAPDIQDTTPHFDSWIVSGEWVRDDSVFPSGAAPGGSKRHDFFVPATGPLNDGDRIVYLVEWYTAAKWKWENTDPNQTLAIDGGTLAVHQIYVALDRNPPGSQDPIAWEPLGWLGNATYRHHSAYHGSSSSVLQPFDGTVDGIGASGWTRTCPSHVPGAESESLTGCTLPGGTYQAHQDSYRRPTDLTPHQRFALEHRGIPMCVQTGMDMYGSHGLPWWNTHGWQNASDFYVQCRVRIWIEPYWW